MKKHADIMRPKFEAVMKSWKENWAAWAIGSWIKPLGGYLFSFDAMEGLCEGNRSKGKRGRAGDDGRRRYIPVWKGSARQQHPHRAVYPTPEELAVAADIFVLSVKLVSIDKLLGNL